MKITELLKEESNRLDNFTSKLEVGKEFLFYDFSKTHLEESKLKEYIKIFENYKDEFKKMENKENINFTEQRKVLHITCRSKKVLKKLAGEKIDLDAEELLVYYELEKLKRFCMDFNNEMTGVTNKKIDTIVNIGIGGSELGVKMISKALDFYKDKNKKIFFISNIDPTDIKLVLDQINMEKTMFVVVTKTWSTVETLENFKIIKTLVSEKLNTEINEVISRHFIAVTSETEKAQESGIDYVFNIWSFVGGRFCIWSAAGISAMLYLGFNTFLEMLYGASVMDEHFFNCETKKNIPILQAIIEIVYNNELNYNNKCIVPYDSYLSEFVTYEQQIELESNGKSKTKNGITNKNTAMIIWGGLGTNAQHSFFQGLHQGTINTLNELLCGLSPLETNNYSVDLHKHLFSNFLGQSKALVEGKKSNIEHETFKGDKPVVNIIYSKLTPGILGALMAAYEHKIFVQGKFWNINSFDQFGVDLGKVLAKEIYENMDNEIKLDQSLANLVDMYLKRRK